MLFLGRKKKDLKGTTTELLGLHSVEPPGGVASNKILGGPEKIINLPGGQINDPSLGKHHSLLHLPRLRMTKVKNH